MSKRILYICAGRSFQSKRPVRKIGDVVKCWRSLGYQVDHICGGDLYGSPVSLEADIKSKTQYYKKWYRQVSFMSPLVQTLSEWKNIRHDSLMFTTLDSCVKQQKPDLIWERNCRLSSSGLRIARKIGVPYVLEWKDNLIPYSVSWFHRRVVKLEEKKNREADFVVVESEKLKDDLGREGVDTRKILVAHNAVNPEEFRTDLKQRQEYRRELGIADGEVLVGYLGSYAFYHDMIRLVLAADILKNKKEIPIKVLMVGQGKQYPEARELAEKRNLLDTRVIMKPWVPSATVPKVLSALDIAVLPGCLDIICPIKVQEYMAQELPSVIPDYPCNREVITDGQTGMLFDPKDEKSLADKLIQLAENRELRIAIGKQAREEVIRRFTWEKTWGKALKEILHRSGLKMS
jgi:glycosyltransferase involved in cell wall biosynthesis